MKIWGLLAIPECVCMSCKTLLYSMCEFRFFAVSGVSALVVVYVPSIIIVSVVPAFKDSAVAYMVASYLPSLVLMFVYAWRVVTNLRDMQAGRPGVWEKHAELDDKVRSSTALVAIPMSAIDDPTRNPSTDYVKMDDGDVDGE
jgi:hypothetical protein